MKFIAGWFSATSIGMPKVAAAAGFRSMMRPSRLMTTTPSMSCSTTRLRMAGVTSSKPKRSTLSFINNAESAKPSVVRSKPGT